MFTAALVLASFMPMTETPPPTPIPTVVVTPTATPTPQPVPVADPNLGLTEERMNVLVAGLGLALLGVGFMVGKNL
jgi:hypothetical protein